MSLSLLVAAVCRASVPPGGVGVCAVQSAGSSFRRCPFAGRPCSRSVPVRALVMGEAGGERTIDRRAVVNEKYSHCARERDAKTYRNARISRAVHTNVTARHGLSLPLVSSTGAVLGCNAYLRPYLRKPLNNIFAGSHDSAPKTSKNTIYTAHTALSLVSMLKLGPNSHGHGLGL